MRIEYIKDSEPHFVGDVIDVTDNDVATSLIENGIAKEVDPRKVELRNVAADMSQDGMSITDKRKKGLMDGDKPSKASKKDDDSSNEDKYADMKGEDLKAELEKRGLPTTGKVDELRDRLRADDSK